MFILAWATKQICKIERGSSLGKSDLMSEDLGSSPSLTTYEPTTVEPFIWTLNINISKNYEPKNTYFFKKMFVDGSLHTILLISHRLFPGNPDTLDQPELRTALFR